jgi:hypothetical protein
MAYLRDIREMCSACKVRRATVELLNRANANMGRFCKQCGKTRLKGAQAYERIQESDRLRA